MDCMYVKSCELVVPTYLAPQLNLECNERMLLAVKYVLVGVDYYHVASEWLNA